MKRIILTAFCIFANISFASEKPAFLFSGELIRSKVVGNVTVISLEDFRKNAHENAKILAIETVNGFEVALVERRDEIALLMPETLFQSAEQNYLVSFVDTCQKECGGAAIGSGITGALTGAVGGAQAGGTMGTAGGPAGITAGAAAGAAIGGTVGAVGGFIVGYEGCVMITDCHNTPPPAPQPETGDGNGMKLETEGGQ